MSAGRRREQVGSFLAQPAADEMALAAGHKPKPASLTGKRLGIFEAGELIGTGGMGQVYRGRDTRLRRDVAIKVLPDEFAHDAERLARFEREATLLASLNHPNVAAIHGLEEQEGVRFLVLELVEGQTLADRLKKGRIPLEETLDICRQIAEGLEAAHHKGIIHRDLKPANVKITPEGMVKILDFGLAKAFYERAAPGDPSKSPTITEQMSAPGVILGTAAYMSPEQARGNPIDKRTDIWAFGCILYECLTGKQTFRGEGITDVIAKVLESEPDWSQLPANTPAIARSLLRRCIQKDPSLRLHDIADVRIEITESIGHVDTAQPVPARRTAHTWIVIALVLGLAAIGMAITLIYTRLKMRPEVAVVRSMIELPAANELTVSSTYPVRTEFALSPDGRYLVLSASNDGKQSNAVLYRRALDRAGAEPIKGTEGARQPFFSPDGKWIGFWANGKLCKVPAEGGIAKELGSCSPSVPPMGVSWSGGGKIFLGDAVKNVLVWIPAEGGELKELTTLDPTREAQHTLPFVLPGGKAVLFTSMPDLFGGRARVEVLSLSSGTRKVLIEDGADARYVPTGHLVFLRQGVLMAVSFDPVRIELTGPVVPVIAGVEQALNVGDSDYHSGAGQFSTSASGLLAYASGGARHKIKTEPVWVDRNGHVEVLTGFDKPDMANHARLSPDGRWLAFLPQNGPMWLFDFERAAYTRLSPEGVSAAPQWSRDGKRLAFSWSDAGPMNVWLASMDGSGALERLTESKCDLWCSSWSPDGRFLAVVESNFKKGQDIVMYNMQERKLVRYLNSQCEETYPEFSPDGFWLAYVSDETGQREVYLRSFPEGNRRVVVSNQGGCEPAWSHNGRELFYRSIKPSRMMKVDISFTPDPSVGVPKALFDFSFLPCVPIRGYDLDPNDRRFLFVRAKEELKPLGITRLNLVLNWSEELTRLCPTGKK